MSQSVLDENKKTVSPEQTGKKSSRKFFLILFIAVFSLSFGVPGAVMIRSAYMKEKICCAETDGTVVDYRSRYHHNDREYSPVVQYRVEEQVFTSETNIWFQNHPLKTGEYVSVYYNPESPDEFYVKQYDLKVEYKLGAVFLLVSIGIVGITVLFAVIGRIKMNKAKKEQLQAKMMLSAVFLFLFIMFICLAGPAITICVFAVMGLIALYGFFQNRRKKENRKQNG